jgi:hypothetical protein
MEDISTQPNQTYRESKSQPLKETSSTEASLTPSQTIRSTCSSERRSSTTVFCSLERTTSSSWVRIDARLTVVKIMTVDFKSTVTSAKSNYNNVGVFNNISLTMPHFSLLSQPNEIDEKIFCDVFNSRNRECIENTNVCRCIHRLKVKLGSIVELVLFDIDDSLTHPFHLHGHKFYVMSMSTFKEHISVDEILKNGVPPTEEKMNPNPTHKDTILIPNHGYVRIKFRADNPGFWLGHCHFDWHLAIGRLKFR